MEPFFKSDIFWLTVPFLTDEQRVPWISHCAEVQTDAPDGTVVTLDQFKIVYVQQASLIYTAHGAASPARADTSHYSLSRLVGRRVRLLHPPRRTGTDRSIVVAYARGARSVAFGKYASNQAALGDLDHERQALQEIKSGGRFQTPSVINAENRLLIISSVRPNRFTQESTLTPALVHGLINFYKDSAQVSTLQEIMPWNHVHSEVAPWARDARMEIPVKILCI